MGPYDRAALWRMERRAVRRSRLTPRIRGSLARGTS